MLLVQFFHQTWEVAFEEVSVELGHVTNDMDSWYLRREGERSRGGGKEKWEGEREGGVAGMDD